MAQALAAGGIGALALLGLLAANLLRDRGIDATVARRGAAVLGGGVYLCAVLLLEPWVAVSLAGAVGIGVLALRLGARRQLRGLSGGAGARERWGEVAYPLAGALSLAVGWGVLGDRGLGFVPLAFMAWGDNAAGFVRDSTRNRRGAPFWPSLAMLAVCLAVALLYQPHWVGVCGALVATAAERFHPTPHPFWDDNWVIVVASLSAMAILARTIM